MNKKRMKNDFPLMGISKIMKKRKEKKKKKEIVKTVTKWKLIKKVINKMKERKKWMTKKGKIEECVSELEKLNINQKKMKRNRN